TYENYLIKFLNSNELKIKEEENDKELLLLSGANVNILIAKAELIDLKAEKEMLLKQRDQLEKEIERSKNLLSNENFIKKAPKEKLDIENEKYQNYEKQYKDVIEKLKKHV